MDLELQFITFVISSGFEVTIDFFYDSFGRRVRLIYHKYRVGWKLRSKGTKHNFIILSSIIFKIWSLEEKISNLTLWIGLWSLMFKHQNWLFLKQAQFMYQTRLLQIKVYRFLLSLPLATYNPVTANYFETYNILLTLLLLKWM